MARLPFSESTRAYLSDYIKYGDAKAGAILSLTLAITGALGIAVEKSGVIGHATHPTVRLLAACILVVTAYSTVMIVVHTIRALDPRTESAAKSLASFPDIAKMTVAEYTAACGALSNTDWSAEYEKHNVTLARVASDKYAHISKSVFWLRWLVVTGYAAFLLAVIAGLNN